MLDDLKIRIKICGLQAFHMVLVVVVGVTGVIGMARIKADFKASNDTHTAALIQLSGVLDRVDRILALVAQANGDTNPGLTAETSSVIVRLERESARLWHDYISSRTTPEEEAVIREGERAWKGYAEALHPAPAAPVQLASLQAVPLAMPTLRLDDAGHGLEAAADSVRRLILLQGKAAEDDYGAANRLFMKLGIFDLLLICGGLGLAALLLFWDFVRLRRKPAAR